MQHIIRFILILQLLGICTVQNVYSQVYNFSYSENKTELYTSFILVGGLQIYDGLRPINTIEDISEIDPQDVWSFDRGAIGLNSTTAQKWSDVLSYTAYATPLVVKLSTQNNEDEFWNVLLMGMHGLAAHTSLNTAFKIWTARPRPYVYDLGQRFIDGNQSKADRKSFYSGHTSATAYLCFFSAKVFSDLQEKSKFIMLAWTTAVAIPALTGFARIKAGKHFASDVIVGFIAGASFGYFIPEIYKTKNLTLSSTGVGIELQYQF